MFAKSKADMAKEQDLQMSAQERIAKIQDIEASAHHKNAQTELDLVKSMLELETMDLDMIHRSYEIAMAIKGQNTDQDISSKQNMAKAV